AARAAPARRALGEWRAAFYYSFPPQSTRGGANEQAGARRAGAGRPRPRCREGAGPRGRRRERGQGARGRRSDPPRLPHRPPADFSLATGEAGGSTTRREQPLDDVAIVRLKRVHGTPETVELGLRFCEALVVGCCEP